MYHPTRGGVRGGRDQFKWDDVKADKHRENYLGHSIKAPVGRWQKGKDLFWYTRDKSGENSEDALKEEIRRVKEEEEQAMREALGLAPKRAKRAQGNRLDKHEYAELVKRGSTAEDLGAGHAEAAQVQGLGLYKAPRNEESSSMQGQLQETRSESPQPKEREESTDEDERKKRKRRDERGDKREEKSSKDRRRDKDKHERRRDRDRDRSSDDRHKNSRHGKDKQRCRHDSDSD
ncbi:Multiple myeloma tumor-associated protein 2 [Rhynchospora pubera]|uniref:Multiple myeloma tumor-associated protein 2 n=1 Tax=Rhynchospora pubera TaxID=906938 RepID=A0AAV8GHH0_9POAL|nr:Multiple myeloma tumor-associated protein 2 [Rhynchospora pubera]